MGKVSDLGNRDTALETDSTYVFTSGHSYKSTFANLIDDLSLVQLDEDGKISADILPDVIVSGGSGDVVGPASAVSGALAVYNGTTGKLLTSLAILDRLIPVGGTNGQFLSVTAGHPAWAASPVPSGGTNGQVLSTNGSGTLTWIDRLPAVGSEGYVLTNVSGVWTAVAPSAGTIDSDDIGAAIIAEDNIVTDMTPDTYILAVQGSTVVKINIGGAAASFDPSAVVTTDSGGNLQTTDYATFADAIGLGASDTVTFNAINLGGSGVTDTTLARSGAGAMTVEGVLAVLENTSPTLTTPTVTSLNVGNADTTLARASAGKVTVEAHPIVATDQSSALTAGFSQTEFAAGTKSSGTFTPDVTNGAMQTATNGGAHTLAPPSASCSMAVLYTNNASAGAITTSGFTKVDGDAFTTTNGHKFTCSIMKSSVGSWLTVKAMQ